MDEHQNNTQAHKSQPEEDEINLLDLAIVLAKHKLAILRVPLVVAAVVAILSINMPDIYTGTARIMPPQQQSTAAAMMLGQLGGFAGGAGAALGLKNPNDLYVGMLQSRTVADALIKQFKLQELYNADTLASTYDILDSTTNITVGMDGIIVIEVDNADPQRAADMANAYVDELYKLTQRLAVSEASQRRLFFEKRLRLVKEQLASAEVALKNTQETTGVLELNEQGRALIEAVANVRAQIAAKEVVLASMRTFATAQNPDYIRTGEELASLRTQLAKLEKGGESGLVPTGRLPEAALATVRKLRDVKYYETLFELTARQYEIAKIDEAKDSSLIQVIDKAVAPDRKSKPKRARMVIITALAAMFIAVLWAFIKEASERAKRNADQAERLYMLRKYLTWKNR